MSPNCNICPFDPAEPSTQHALAHMNPCKSFLLALTAFLAAQSGALAQLTMNGAGATFPYPIYSKWFDEYAKVGPFRAVQLPVDRLRGRAKANCRADGRFRRVGRPDERCQPGQGAREAPAHPDRRRRGRHDLQPAGSPGLKLDGPALAKIFLGTITKWNDPAIAALNPGVKPAGFGHHRRASLGWQRHLLSFSRIISAR